MQRCLLFAVSSQIFCQIHTGLGSSSQSRCRTPWSHTNPKEKNQTPQSLLFKLRRSSSCTLLSKDRCGYLFCLLVSRSVECLSSRIIHYVALLVWFLSFIGMHLRISQVARLCLILFNSEVHSIVISVLLLVAHLLAGEYLDSWLCF